MERVGPVLGKEKKFTKLQASLAQQKTNTNHDIVPIGLKEFREICEEMSWPGKAKGGPRGRGMRGRAFKFLHPTEGQFVSRSRFAAFCEEFQYKGKHSTCLIPGVAWERVSSVTPLGVLPVFDLTVPTNHNFVANGMVVHNTGVDVLLSMVVPNVQRAWLLIPPGLREQFRLDYQVWSQHFKVPNVAGNTGPYYADRPVLSVVAYSELSHPSSSVRLMTDAPNLIISDEGQNLRDRKSVRTGRFLRYLASKPERSSSSIPVA